MTHTGRVLVVENVRLDDEGIPSGEKATEQLDDQIRLLLPLTLPSLEEGDMRQDHGDAIALLSASMPGTVDAALSAAVIAASAQGEGAVTGAMSEMFARALALRSGA